MQENLSDFDDQLESANAGAEDDQEKRQQDEVQQSKEHLLNSHQHP
jgi:hypothetical protein